MRGSERFAERERESKPDSAVFEWLGARARARARTANAERVPAGMFSLIADSGMILFVSGVSNLIDRPGSGQDISTDVRGVISQNFALPGTPM